jgi:c-di-GMP-binding flagellar brake protein YcgR
MTPLDTHPAPLTDADRFDPVSGFRVDSTREITSLMRQLNDAATPIQLVSPDGMVVRTILWSVDPDAGRLSFRADPDDHQMTRLIEGDDATAVAYLDAVKLQFDLQDMLLVRGSRACAMQASMPRQMYRFQRRQAFRVRTLDRGMPTAVVRHPSIPDMTLQLPVVDVSIGGCALLLSDTTPPLEPGSELHGVLVALDADTRFVATLRLHHVTSIQPHGQGVRLGCGLSGLSGESERALQRYIDHTQKRRRLLSLS